jgi:hypothetical protein
VISDLADARRELLAKTREDIERETAWKWAARAVAAYELAQVRRFPVARTLMHDARTYLDEAIEHAAMADRTGAVMRAVRDWVDQQVPAGAI